MSGNFAGELFIKLTPDAGPEFRKQAEKDIEKSAVGLDVPVGLMLKTGWNKDFTAHLKKKTETAAKASVPVGIKLKTGWNKEFRAEVTAKAKTAKKAEIPVAVKLKDGAIAEAMAEAATKAQAARIGAEIDVDVEISKGAAAKLVAEANAVAETVEAAMRANPIDIPLDIDDDTRKKIAAKAIERAAVTEATLTATKKAGLDRRSIEELKASNTMKAIAARREADLAKIAERGQQRRTADRSFGLFQAAQASRTLRNDLSGLEFATTRMLRRLGIGFGLFTTGVVASFGAIAAAALVQFAKVETAATKASSIFSAQVLGGQITDAIRQRDFIVSTNRDINQQVIEESRRVALETKFDTEQIAEGFRFLAGAGVDLNTSLASMGRVARFAQAGFIEIEDASELLIQGFVASGRSIKDFDDDIDGLTDKLTFLAQEAPITLEEGLKAFANNAAASFAAFGQTAEEALNVIGLLGRTGVKGLTAGTQAAILVRELNRAASVKAPEAFQKYGIALKDANGEARSFALVLDDITRLFAEQTNEFKDPAAFSQLKAEFEITEKSSRAFQQVLPQIRELQNAGGGAAEELNRLINTSTGRLAAQTELITDTLGFQFEQFVNGVQNLAQVFAEPLGDAIKEFLQEINGEAEGATDQMAALSDRARELGENVRDSIRGGLDDLRGAEGRTFFAGIVEGYRATLAGVRDAFIEFRRVVYGADSEESFLAVLGNAFAAVGRFVERTLPDIANALGVITVFIRENEEAIKQWVRVWIGIFVASKFNRWFILPLLGIAENLGRVSRLLTALGSTATVSGLASTTSQLAQMSRTAQGLAVAQAGLGATQVAGPGAGTAVKGGGAATTAASIAVGSGVTAFGTTAALKKQAGLLKKMTAEQLALTRGYQQIPNDAARAVNIGLRDLTDQKAGLGRVAGGGGLAEEMGLVPGRKADGTVVSGLADELNAVGDAADDAAKKTGKLAKVRAFLLPSLSEITGVLSRVKDALSGWGPRLKVIGKFASRTFFWVGLIVTAGEAIYNWWKGFSDEFKKGLEENEDAAQTFSKIGEWLRDAFDKVVEALDWALEKLDKLWSFLMGIAEAEGRRAANMLIGIADAIADIARWADRTWESLQPFFRILKAGAQTAWNALMALKDGFVVFAAGWIEQIRILSDLLTGDITLVEAARRLGESIATSLDTAWEAIKASFKKRMKDAFSPENVAELLIDASDLGLDIAGKIISGLSDGLGAVGDAVRILSPSAGAALDAIALAADVVGTRFSRASDAVDGLRTATEEAAYAAGRFEFADRPDVQLRLTQEARTAQAELKRITEEREQALREAAWQMRAFFRRSSTDLAIWLTDLGLSEGTAEQWAIRMGTYAGTVRDDWIEATGLMGTALDWLEDRLMDFRVLQAGEQAVANLQPQLFADADQRFRDAVAAAEAAGVELTSADEARLNAEAFMEANAILDAERANAMALARAGVEQTAFATQSLNEALAAAAPRWQSWEQNAGMAAAAADAAAGAADGLGDSFEAVDPTLIGDDGEAAEAFRSIEDAANGAADGVAQLTRPQLRQASALLADINTDLADSYQLTASQLQILENAMPVLDFALERQRQAVQALDEQLQSLRDTQLEGTQAFSDQTFAINQQINELELQKLEKIARGTDPEEISIFRIDERLEKLRQQAQLVSLREQVELDPLRRELDQLFNPPAQELPFEEIKRRFEELTTARDGATEILTQNEALRERLGQLLEGTQRQFEELGFGVSAGFTQGVESGNDDIYKAAIANANTYVVALDEVFRFGSPSRTTREIGDWIGQGLEQGIDDSRDGVLSATRVVRSGIIEVLRTGEPSARDAGERVMRGFFFGMRNFWVDTVRPFVLDIAVWIRENKGPISYDAQLLRPAGEAMMSGFHRGLQDGFGEIKAWVGTVGPSIANDGFPKDIFVKRSANFLIGNARSDLDFDPESTFGDLVPGRIAAYAGALDPSLAFLHKTKSLADTLDMASHLARLYGLQVSSGYRRFDYDSNHSKGTAADLSNGFQPTKEMDELARDVAPLFGKVFRQIIYRNRDIPRGWRIGNHMDHVHLDWIPDFDFKLGSGRKGVGMGLDFPGSSAIVDQALYRAALDTGVPVQLLGAIARAESGFRSNAVSPAGAGGLMQLIPSTARSLGVGNVFDPFQNARGGATYIAQQLDRFNGNLRLALSAYNAGPGAAATALTSYPETINYVRNVLEYLRQFGGWSGWGGFRAMGGSVNAGTAYTVGERGRELFIPDQNGSIISNKNVRDLIHAMNATGSGSAGTVVNDNRQITVKSNSPDPMAVAAQVDARMRAQIVGVHR